MDLHVFPIPIPPSHLPLHLIPVHQPQALVSCIQPGLVICFNKTSFNKYKKISTLANIFSEHNAMKLEINNKKNGKFLCENETTHSWTTIESKKKSKSILKEAIMEMQYSITYGMQQKQF